jgi:hypothetical protein
MVLTGLALFLDCAVRALVDDTGTTWSEVLGWVLALTGWLALRFRYRDSFAVHRPSGRW